MLSGNIKDNLSASGEPCRIVFRSISADFLHDGLGKTSELGANPSPNAWPSNYYNQDADAYFDILD